MTTFIMNSKLPNYECSCIKFFNLNGWYSDELNIHSTPLWNHMLSCYEQTQSKCGQRKLKKHIYSRRCNKGQCVKFLYFVFSCDYILGVYLT